MFSIIAAIGKNRELGKNGDLVFHLKDDMKFFRETTTGHKVVMGRKTWESLPHKLPNRTNIVISSHIIKDADEHYFNIEEFVKKYEDADEEIFIIGGASIYNAFLPYAKHLYLTEIESSTNADVFFPEFVRSDYSREVIKKGKEDDLKYQIIHYIKH